MPPARPLAAAVLAALLAVAAPVSAQEPPPAPGSEAARAAQRFPQPVQAGVLIHRQVLRPVEQQDVLGRVSAVVRGPDGAVLIVVDARDAGWRGVLGLGARPVAVPADAMALLGEHLALMDLTPEQLRARPTFDPAGTAPVPPGETIRMGLVRPFH